MLTAITFSLDKPSKAYVLRDVLDIEFTTAALGGFIDATIKLGRPAGRNYADVGYNFHVQILDPWGGVVSEGRIYGLPQTEAEAAYSYDVQVCGYCINLAEQPTWKPYYPTATDIATIIRDGVSGYAPQLSASATTVPATGTLVQYGPDNPSTPRAHIDELLKYGNSGYYELMWQVWENRVFYAKPKPAVSGAVYDASLRNAAGADMGINGDTFYNQISIKYKTDTDVKIYTLPSTTWQQRYATTFGSNNPAATAVNLVRDPGVIDITNHGAITDAQAQQMAQTILNNYINYGVKVRVSRMSFNRADAIKDARTGQPWQPYRVRAGQWTIVRDVFGTDSGLPSGQSSMFVVSTKYTMSSNTLELAGEQGQSIDNLLARLVAHTRAYLNLINTAG